MRDHLWVINVLFFSLALFVAIAIFVTCVWSDSVRMDAPIKRHNVSTTAANKHTRSMEKI